MTNTEIIDALRTHNQWRKGNGGPQMSSEKLTEVIDAAIAALTPQPQKEHLPEPEPAPVKAKKK